MIKMQNFTTFMLYECRKARRLCFAHAHSTCMQERRAVAPLHGYLKQKMSICMAAAQAEAEPEEHFLLR